MRRLALLLAVLLALPARAVGLAAGLPVETERLLWCSSAFYWLAADAYDAGDNAEGDRYQSWSDDLGARATTLLQAQGEDQAAIDTLRDDYDNRVLGEMDTPDAKFDVMACPELVRP